MLKGSEADISIHTRKENCLNLVCRVVEAILLELRIIVPIVVEVALFSEDLLSISIEVGRVMSFVGHVKDSTQHCEIFK
ncbi:hypothetical protein Ahy_A08g038111 isoform C [Arachis hypogaea]|uniref:Uncharacterized protein n=1 Tax=Arachis hypogaea TaxID=3818 RepID=A0A445BSM1_ARAHY|nr:hypothetical protein Ahy_A08g038111 isoform C [Arachis hypogaea]